MRDDGENGMSVVREVGTPMEEGIMESLCDVAIRTNGLLANYLRFSGRVRDVRGRESAEDPLGTVLCPPVPWRLAPGLVDENRWSVFPRRSLVLEAICQLPRWDVRTVALVVNQNGEIGGQVIE